MSLGPVGILEARRALSPIPPSIAGLVQWLDASIDWSIDYTGPPLVSTWRDLSPSGHHMANSYPPEFPTRSVGGLKAGLSSIDWAGAQALNGASSSGANQKPFTLFAALKHTGAAASRAILATNNVGGMNWQLGSTHQQVINKHNVVGVGTSTTVVPTNTPSILCVTYSATGELTFYYDNVADAPVTNNQTFDANPPQARVGVGSAQNFTGTIGEILKYNSVLSATDRTTIYSYLARKWLVSQRFIFPGVEGNHLSVPNVNSGTGNLEVVVRASVDVWTSAFYDSFVSNRDANGIEFLFRRQAGGRALALVWHDNNNSQVYQPNSAIVPASVLDRQMIWMRAQLVASTGVVTYSWALDQINEPTTWTALGTGASIANTVRRAASNAAAIGWDGFTTGTQNPMHNGRIARAIVRTNNTGGTTVLDVNESDAEGKAPSVNGTTFTATVGGTVTVAQTAGNTIIQEP